MITKTLLGLDGSLPPSKDGYRQFFKRVISGVVPNITFSRLSLSENDVVIV